MILFQHQIDVLRKTRKNMNCAYYLDMGLGKTFVGSEKMIDYGCRVNLIVCQKSKINDWILHYKMNYLYTTIVFNLTNAKEMDLFLRCTKGLEPRSEGYILVGIVNYDLIWRRKVLLDLRYFTMILDESSLIQNKTSKRTKFILKLRPMHVILLSGTPVDGRYERLWTQIHLLGWDIKERTFLNSYVVEDYVTDRRGNKVLNPVNGRPLKQVTGYKNVRHLKKKLAEYGCVFMKTEEAMDLPDQVFQNVMVELPREYKAFIRNRIITIGDDTLVGDTPLTNLLYKRELCSVYCPDKIRAMTDLLDSTTERFIVFYNFKEELNKMLEAVTDRPVSIVNGSVKDLENYEKYDNSVTFVQYQAGAYGLNLQKARRTIYLSLPLSSEQFEQSKKRTHRIGQEKRCFYYILMCSYGIEEDIFKTLKKRRDYTYDLYEGDKEWLRKNNLKVK